MSSSSTPNHSTESLAPSDSLSLRQHIQLNFATLGYPEWVDPIDSNSQAQSQWSSDLLMVIRQQEEIREGKRCPADQRIEAFLENHFADLHLDSPLKLPGQTFLLSKAGIARELSLPVDADSFKSDLVSSHRVRNGILNNPKHDRRTTKGTFHVAEGGLPVPATKKAVPKATFAKLFEHAIHPPSDMMLLPYTSNAEKPVRTILSLLLRPLVSPEVPGFSSRKTMEIRFFAPGSLVSNLDFVEAIFGNAGNPFLNDNDAALDAQSWTGHTGCVIVAPHLIKLTKKELGLPPVSEATERQIQDGMAWESETELYNDGTPFKITCRDEQGIMVTLIADNYYGYCKKEVKTQINYAANLYGNVEEEHAGGAIAFRSYNLGDQYRSNSYKYNERTFAQVCESFNDIIDVHEDGYAVDKNYPSILYVPEKTDFDVKSLTVSWEKDGEQKSILLQSGVTYITTSGYKIELRKHPQAPSWRLVGTMGEGTFCHKPCTVSGGGKSEISKSLSDYILYGNIYVKDQEEDFKLIEEIFNRDYRDRWLSGKEPIKYTPDRPSRPILSPLRSLGSVIKLLTPSPSEYNEKYNEWLRSIPDHIYAMVFIIKRFYRDDWQGQWKDKFGVDIVNGSKGHELKFANRALVGFYLRVGLASPTQWRTYKLRQDYVPADKVQLEDDISASVVVAAERLQPLNQDYDYESASSVKLIKNCENRLFQRPDDAVHRGLDKQTEWDLAQDDNFLSNFEPLTREEISQKVDRVIDFEHFTQPMKDFLIETAESDSNFAVCSDSPRLMDGVPTKNPRYLQKRPDLVDPRPMYLAHMGTRLFRGLKWNAPVSLPVNAVLFGRRTNPPHKEMGIRNLAVYNPIHYQELPELFMDFICSLTGKSPSTTGAGSEGALTKGPFNALRPLPDLNNALVSYIITELHGYSTAAGFVGPDYRIDHDISLLIPEIWCRLDPSERDPNYLIENDYLEKIEDFEHEGKTIYASRLGYRMTYRFVRAFFGRIFDNPNQVFEQEMLQPEKQDYESYVDGILNITEAQQRVAQDYLDDDSVEDACPPLKALLWIMATGSYKGEDINSPKIRKLFTKEYMLSSSWYQERLKKKQEREVELWTRHVNSLQSFYDDPRNEQEVRRLDIRARLNEAKEKKQLVESSEYLNSLKGTLGADLLGPYGEE